MENIFDWKQKVLQTFNLQQFFIGFKILSLEESFLPLTLIIFLKYLNLIVTMTMQCLP